jgi:glyoxylase-like metal-dependent hydrolase (beta-lactamase superfamily II)
MERPSEIQVGSIRIALLTDGYWRNDGGCMFGVVPRELWKRNHPPDDRNRIRLNLICPLIIRGREAILVDTGIGNRLSAVERRIFDYGDGWLLDGLRALGMEPGDVTAVILSHLHFDHCGGIVRRRESGVLEPAFPRAKLLVQRGELDHARGATNERLRAAYHHVEQCLAPNVKSIEALNGDTALNADVRVEMSGGHTGDHQVVIAGHGAHTFIQLADIVPTRSHMAGPWNQAYDVEPLVTMQRKAAYLERATREGWWISFAHDDRVLAARVIRDGGRFALADSINSSGE